MIANCSHDENGKYKNGKAGDQTGGEYTRRKWYNRPWSHVIRFEDSTIANLIAELATEAADNNCIGYDQNERLTFWKQLQKYSYRPKNIKVKCETDCSASTAAIIKAVGYLLNNDKLKSIPETCYSGNIRVALKNRGAKVFTEDKYLKSDSYLKRGDILLYEGHHVTINLDDGSKVKATNIGSTFEVMVTADSLYVRSGAGKSYNAIGVVHFGEELTVTKTVENGTKRWYKIKHNNMEGYVSSAYTKKV